MKSKCSVSLLLVILAIGILLIIHIRGCCQRDAIERGTYLWTKGVIYCAECKARERIKSVWVEDEFTVNDEYRTKQRLVYIATVKHHGECRAFEVLATVDGSCIKNLTIGKWPGKSWDAIAED